MSDAETDKEHKICMDLIRQFNRGELTAEELSEKCKKYIKDPGPPTVKVCEIPDDEPPF